MRSTRLYEQFLSRVIASVGQFRDVVLPRYAAPAAARRATAARARRRRPAAPPH